MKLLMCISDYVNNYNLEDTNGSVQQFLIPVNEY